MLERGCSDNAEVQTLRGLRVHWRSLITQEVGLVTLRVMSRPGRITQPGHVMTIVRNVAGPEATSTVGRVRMLVDRKESMEARCCLSSA